VSDQTNPPGGVEGHSGTHDAFDFAGVPNAICHHFHNYLICSAVYLAGAAATAHPEWAIVGRLGATIGYPVMLLGVLLALLNTVAVVQFIWREFRPVKVKGMMASRGHNFRLLVLFMYLAVVYVIVAVTINVKILTGDAGH
jgi:hypothetical protein